MSDTNIGAGKVTLNYEGSTPDTFDQVAGELYDPLPELAISRDALDDSNTGHKFERTKAGIRKVAALQYKIKTTAAGLSTMKSDFESGAERKWQYVIPSDETQEGGDEAVVITAWISELKKVPSLKDETFVFVTLNVNAVE